MSIAKKEARPKMGQPSMVHSEPLNRVGRYLARNDTDERTKVIDPRQRG